MRRLLASESINVNAAHDWHNGETPLMVACANGHENVVRALLERGDIRVNQADKRGLNALHIATLEGLENVVEILLGHNDIQVGLVSFLQCYMMGHE